MPWEGWAEARIHQETLLPESHGVLVPSLVPYPVTKRFWGRVLNPHSMEKKAEV